MTRLMRVMHVALSLSPGGAERLVVGLSRHLHPAVPTCICCLDESGAWAHEVRAGGVEVFELNRRPGFQPSLGLRIAGLAKRLGVTVLHCHQYSPFVYGTLAGLRRRGLRIVFTEHGRLSDALPSRRRRLANRLLGWRPDAVVAVSHELRAHMIAEGFSPSCVRVIHNGVDPGEAPTEADRLRARRALGLTDEAFVVGTVARLDPVKGLDVLVDAFAAVAPSVPEARLVLVGGGVEEASLRRRANEQGLEPRMLFTGVRHDARTVLSAFDVYANTSITEGMSLTLLEAMAASKPVIATRVGGTPEIVADGTTGLLVPPGDVRSVAESIVALRRDAAWRSAMGTAARARVVEHFSFENMAREYVAAYRGSLGGQLRGAPPGARKDEDDHGAPRR